MRDSSSTKSDKRQTLRRMLAVAHDEFASKGLSGARIDEIARIAGVTKQLIFHYYGSKEGLFVAVLDEASENLMSEWVTFDVEHLPPPEALRALLEHFFHQYCSNPLLGTLAQEGTRYHGCHDTPRNRFQELAPVLIDKVSAIVQRGIETGDFKVDVQPRLLVATAALITTGWFTNSYSTSTLAGLNAASAEGLAIWRSYSVGFILSSIAAVKTPAQTSSHIPTRDPSGYSRRATACFAYSGVVWQGAPHAS